MKKTPVIYLSLIGAIAFSILQVLLIVKNYQLQKENIYNKYTSHIKKALFEAQNTDDDLGLHKSWNTLENISEAYLSERFFIDHKQKKQDSLFLKAVYKIISQNDNIPVYLQSYLKEQNLSDDFETNFIITEFSILDFSKEVNLLKKEKLQLKNNSAIQPYFINTERDFFRIRLAYYVDFRDEQKLILKEMAGMLTLNIISIVLVFGIFIYTLAKYISQKRLSDVKSEFINSITHELKTPLTNIGMAAASLEIEPFINSKEKIQELTSIIKRQNRYLSELVDNVLKAAFSGKKQFSKNKQDEDLSKLLFDIADDFEKGHIDCCTIKKSIEPSSLIHKVDKTAFTVMISNLLDNAVKYSKEKAKIELALFEKDNSIIVSIKDYGPGIPAEYQHKVFEEFVRLPNSKTKKGFGLGLYTVKKIALEHNGNVNIDSETKTGTNVVIKLKKI